MARCLHEQCPGLRGESGSPDIPLAFANSQGNSLSSSAQRCEFVYRGCGLGAHGEIDPTHNRSQLDTALDIFTLREKYFENPLMYNAAIMTRRDALVQAAPGFLPNQRE
jgi:hypothetical protein